MKNDDAPKVTVILVSNNLVSGFLRIGEFNGMGELFLHATKFRSSNFVPRIVIYFRYQTRPRSFNGTVYLFEASICDSHRSYAVPNDGYFPSFVIFAGTVDEYLPCPFPTPK